MGDIKTPIKEILAPGGALLLSLIGANPYLQLARISAFGLFGVYLKYNQDKLNEFTEYIRDNIEWFSKDIVETNSFRDGFLITFEQYIKERNIEKRKIIQQIFMGYTKLNEKQREHFEIERIYNINSLISVNAVEGLKFIQEVIIPIKEKYIEEKSAKSEHPKEEGGENKEWRKKELDDKEPITKFRGKYIYENFDSNSEKIKQKYGGNIEDYILLGEISDKEKIEEKKMKNIVDELNVLGIFYSRYRHIGTIGGGTDDSGSNFTPIGKKYLEFLNNTFKSKSLA